MWYYLILLVLGMVGLVTPQIFACECEFLTLDDHLKNADVVFQGTAIWAPAPSEKSLVASFSAVDVFKRPPPEFDHVFNEGKINVTTGIDSGSCGVNFQAANTYIVFGNISKDKIHTSTCSGTSNIENYLEQMLYFQHYESSPYEQFVAGIPIEEIRCKDDRVLVVKSSDGSPACVTKETKQKLIERGWAKNDLQKPKDSSDTTQCQGSKLCLTEEVTRIIDGDTIYLTGGYKVRLSLTNTPERNELGFSEASQFTANMCPVGSTVMVDQDDLQPYDVYDRLLGKVICDSKVLNAELLYNDHANILTRYCSTSEFSNEIWAQEFGC